MRLKGKIALVTAAGQGIGQAAALAMAAEGATVYATDVNPELLKSYEGVANVHTAVLNVLDKNAIAAQVASMDRIDVIFNCAGFVHNGSIVEAKDEEWEFAFNLNVRSQFWMIQAVLPAMLATGGGSIINMASVCSSIKGLPNRFIYGTTKAAVIGLTKAIAADYIKQGIRVNAICPGFFPSKMTMGTLKALGEEKLAANAPLRRLGDDEDLKGLTLLYASDAGKHITGQWLAVDGGVSVITGG